MNGRKERLNLTFGACVVIVMNPAHKPERPRRCRTPLLLTEISALHCRKWLYINAAHICFALD